MELLQFVKIRGQNTHKKKIWDELRFKGTQSESVANPSISAVSIQKFNIGPSEITCGRKEHFKNIGLEKPNQDVNPSKTDQLGSIV